MTAMTLGTAINVMLDYHRYELMVGGLIANFPQGKRDLYLYPGNLPLNQHAVPKTSIVRQYYVCTE